MSAWMRVLGLMALALTLVGCAESAGEGVATLGGGASETSSAAPEAAADPEQAMLDFTQCMRDEGVDMPDPQGSGGGIIINRDSGIDPESPTFKAAQQKCRPLLEEVMKQGEGRRDPEEQARMREALLEFAECMRNEGVDFPDPQFNGGTMRAGPGEGVDPDDPDFQAASERCRDRLPDGGVVREGRP